MRRLDVGALRMAVLAWSVGGVAAITITYSFWLWFSAVVILALVLLIATEHGAALDDGEDPDEWLAAQTKTETGTETDDQDRRPE